MSEIPDIQDACPECGCTDVTDSHGNTQARYQRPQYFCYGCGVRFNNPRRVDVTTGERV
ncbi:Zn finger [Halorubrum tailed virus 28]|uniref:Zn finger n=1 Tax=Halorubrum tailed virus 28 TaxID=2878009 RepID=A0AAE8XZX4_9CAUD|nr:Zn finger [Halorubrum tailed virus 28]UBF23442.1 Zn finger [Halorubrum tailed virus 28]